MTATTDVHHQGLGPGRMPGFMDTMATKKRRPGSSFAWRSGATSSNDVLRAIVHDTIIGGTGNDQISAGPGDDTIYGGPGKDKLKGGSGNDRGIDSDSNTTLLLE